MSHHVRWLVGRLVDWFVNFLKGALDGCHTRHMSHFWNDLLTKKRKMVSYENEKCTFKSSWVIFDFRESSYVNTRWIYLLFSCSSVSCDLVIIKSVTCLCMIHPVCRSIGRKVTLPCSYRSTCFYLINQFFILSG